MKSIFSEDLSKALGIISSLNFINKTDDGLVATHDNHEFTLNMSFDVIPKSIRGNMPSVQAKIRLISHGRMVWAWGATTEAENILIVDTYTTIKHSLDGKLMRELDEKRNAATASLKTLG